MFQSQIEGGKLRVQSITEAITESYECEMKEGTEERKDLCKLEHNRAFVDVANQFKIIDDERITAVADETLMEKLKRGEKVTPRELQRGSVRLPLSVAERLGLLGEELPFLPPGQYDDFLGYMAGLV